MTTKSVLNEKWYCDRVLGTGGFGIVQLWVHSQSGQKLAIKKCKWDSTQLTETQKRRWTNEVQIMKRLKHPNIVKALDLPFKLPSEDIHMPILCMEYCRQGDLRRVLNKMENCCGINEKDAISVMRDIASAVEFLHSNNITHRDLKPENIVLQDEYNKISYKLIDLGYAKELGEASSCASIVGTLNYVAPELLWKQRYSCSVDYWSLGILFYELVTGTRPFLPRMQHTTTWMQHVKNKEYDAICAYETEGQIVFGKDIVGPTHISRCLREKLVEWFRVVLQWDPKKRGKQYNESGLMDLVVFELLHSILSKKIVYVFSISSYSINAYELIESTNIINLQSLIEKDTHIPANQQILTDYFGNVLVANCMPLLTQTQDPVLFVFKQGNSIIESTPAVVIPVPVQKMLESPRNRLDYDTLKDYYRETIFFIKQEVYLFQLYIFALSIKVDLICARLNAFNENIAGTLVNINVLLTELNNIRAKWDNEIIDIKMKKALEMNFEKVVKLVNAAEQIKMNFNPLIEESNELKNAAQSIDCVKEISQLYDKALGMLAILKMYINPHETGKPTEMVKLVFEFLTVRDAQFRNENISEIWRQILKLEMELLTLDRIFDSVIAMTTVYREELERILQCNLQCNSVLNPSNNDASPGASFMSNQSISQSNTMEISSEIDVSHSRNKSGMECSNTVDTDNDVIYDNLVMRYTLDNLLIEIQKKYMEMVTLDP